TLTAYGTVTSSMRMPVAVRAHGGQTERMSTPIGEHHYALTATWTGDRGSGTSGYREYDRDVTLQVRGKPELLGSADRPFRGDATRWNPEDMLLGALTQCHLLSY